MDSDKFYLGSCWKSEAGKGQLRGVQVPLEISGYFQKNQVREGDISKAEIGLTRIWPHLSSLPKAIPGLPTECGFSAQFYFSTQKYGMLFGGMFGGRRRKRESRNWCPFLARGGFFLIASYMEIMKLMLGALNYITSTSKEVKISHFRKLFSSLLSLI